MATHSSLGCVLALSAAPGLDVVAVRPGPVQRRVRRMLVRAGGNAVQFSTLISGCRWRSDSHRCHSLKQLGSRRFNAWNDCPYLYAGFKGDDSHRPLLDDLWRLLLICTSSESANRGFSLRTSALAFTTQFPLCGRRRPSARRALHRPEPLDPRSVCYDAPSHSGGPKCQSVE
jgi:hypothetical protein